MPPTLISLLQLSKETLEHHLKTLIRNQALVSAHQSAYRYFAFVMLSTILTMLYPKTSILLAPAAFYCLIKGTLLGNSQTDSLRCSIDVAKNQLDIHTPGAHVTVEPLSNFIPTPAASSTLHTDAADDNSHDAPSTLRARRGFSI